MLFSVEHTVTIQTNAAKQCFLVVSIFMDYQVVPGF